MKIVEIDDYSKENFIAFSYGITFRYKHNYKKWSDIKLVNCYARDMSSDPCSVTFDGDETVVTDDQLASGEIAYRLNAGRTGSDAVWRQTIGTDTIPMHATFSPRSMEVYHKGADAATVGTAGWGTLFYPAATTLPDGVRAYTVAEVKNGDLVLQEVSGAVPAYTPVILCTLPEGETSAEAVTIPLVGTYYNKADGKGILRGVYERTAAHDGWYIMQKQDGEVAFYQVDTSVVQPYLPAWRCYLDGIGTAAYSKLRLTFGDATGIEEALTPILSDGAIYDLEGRKVQTLQKGHIYIKNGKKIYVR